MKNIILFSTILAAGTLAANAATTIDAVVHLNFDTLVSGSTQLDINNLGTLPDGATVTKDGGGNLNFHNSDSTSGNYSDATIGSYSFRNNSTHLILTDVVGWKESWTMAFTFKSPGTTSGYNRIFGFGDTTHYISIGQRNHKDTGLGFWGDSSDFTTSNTRSIALGSVMKVALVYDYSDTENKGSFKLYVDGTEVSTSADVTPGDGWATNILIGSGYGGSNGKLSSGVYDEFVVYKTALDKNLVTAYLSDGSVASPASIPIPEPSMFGLLAGIGALALAGTRRRKVK